MDSDKKENRKRRRKPSGIRKDIEVRTIKPYNAEGTNNRILMKVSPANVHFQISVLPYVSQDRD